jgi:outer membrane protein TolC
MPRVSWATVALLLLPCTAAAQDPLTLDRAIQAVLAGNPRLAAARAGADEARSAADGARATLFPRVTVSESWQRANEPVFVFGSILSARRFTASNFALDFLNHPPATSAFRTTIGADQIVFDGGRRSAAERAARLEADAAGLLADARTLDLAAAATETFGRVLAAQAAERAATAGLESAREDHARAVRRRDAGMATDADVLTLAVHVADLERRRIQAHGEAAVGIAELNRLMGEPIEREWRAVDAAAADDAPAAPPLETLFAEADRMRPDLRRYATLEAAARQQSRSAARLLVPQAIVQGAVDFAGTTFDQRASAWIAGAELRWSWSPGGAETARQRAAASAVTRAHAEADDARAAAHVEVLTAVRRIETAAARRAASRAAVDQAREAQRIIRDRFEAGVTGVDEVLRASTALLDAEANGVAAAVDAMIGAAALRRALGRTP